MFRIMKENRIIGVSVNPMFVKRSDNGQWIACEEREAEAVNYKDARYSVNGHEIEGLEPVVVVEDNGQLLADILDMVLDLMEVSVPAVSEESGAVGIMALSAETVNTANAKKWAHLVRFRRAHLDDVPEEYRAEVENRFGLGKPTESEQPTRKKQGKKPKKTESTEEASAE